MGGETCLHKEITFIFLRDEMQGFTQTSANSDHCLCMLWKGGNQNEVYVGWLNEKDSSLIHFGKEKRLSKCCQLRAQTVSEDTNGKEMATILTHFFLLPVLRLHCLQKETHHIHPSSTL